MAIVLLITTKDGQTIELPVLDKLTIGRSKRSDLALEDGEMSGNHGFFDLGERGELIYSDLDSTNGSYLNNNRIQKINLKVNETLRLGTTLIKIDAGKLTSSERLITGSGPSLNAGFSLTNLAPSMPEKKKRGESKLLKLEKKRVNKK
jgi:pSer/pThr/pTyr-binding forkhead associated (FHA) protein